MKTYTVRYASYVEIEVKAKDEDSALDKADEMLLGFTGADFRECAEFTGIEES